MWPTWERGFGLRCHAVTAPVSFYASWADAMAADPAVVASLAAGGGLADMPPASLQHMQGARTQTLNLLAPSGEETAAPAVLKEVGGVCGALPRKSSRRLSAKVHQRRFDQLLSDARGTTATLPIAAALMEHSKQEGAAAWTRITPRVGDDGVLVGAMSSLLFRTAVCRILCLPPILCRRLGTDCAACGKVMDAAGEHLFRCQRGDAVPEITVRHDLFQLKTIECLKAAGYVVRLEVTDVLDEAAGRARPDIFVMDYGRGHRDMLMDNVTTATATAGGSLCEKVADGKAHAALKTAERSKVLETSEKARRVGADFLPLGASASGGFGAGTIRMLDRAALRARDIHAVAPDQWRAEWLGQLSMAVVMAFARSLHRLVNVQVALQAGRAGRRHRAGLRSGGGRED